MRNFLSRFAADEMGATAIEYGLIAAGISVAIIAVVNGLGTSLNSKFQSISTQLGGGSTGVKNFLIQRNWVNSGSGYCATSY